ncbi:MAG: dihydroorotate dehydrogenase electron transfer subunit [Candidatus Omnitrophota bacterium]
MKTSKNKKILQGKIISNKKTAPDHFEIAIQNEWLARNSRPGQFVMIKVQDKNNDPLLRIPLGVHFTEKDRTYLLYKIVGAGTETLCQRQKGEVISVLGPLGNGFDLRGLSEKKEALIVAGGHGIVPLYMLAKELRKRGMKVTVFEGACGKEHILCKNKLKKIGAKIFIATENGTLGQKGRVTDILSKYLKAVKKNPKQKEFPQKYEMYVCGPKPMIESVNKIAKEFEIKTQISFAEYMACGIGACLGCAIMTVDGYKMTCKDGPVFDSRQIKWDAA